MTRTNSTCVYRCRAADGQLLYVGCSLHTATRIPQHRHKPWWLEVTRVDVEHFDSVEAATAAEKAAIETEAPVHNKRAGRVITEQELAERRERRLAGERRGEEIREEQRRFNQSTYPAAAECVNCGRKGEFRFPKGVAVEDHPCRVCGVAAFERREAA